MPDTIDIGFEYCTVCGTNTVNCYILAVLIRTDEGIGPIASM